MSSYNNFENNFNKYSHSDDLSKKPKSMIKERDLSDKRKNNIKLWTTFYRRNIHRFIEHYFGVKLFFFQKIWLYLMGISEIFMCIASRGISKSYLIALYCLAISVLLPKSEIVIAAGTKKQASLIVTEKIQKIFQKDYPNIAREIKKITANGDDWLVELHNGSTIQIVSATDNARGHRSTCNIYEEFRLIDKNILDSVLSPFLYSRQPPYLLNPEYSHLAEEPKEIYISSAWYKTEWIWDELKKVVKMHYKGDNAMFIAFDYLLAVHHNLKTKKQIKKEKTKSDEITFMMEYENIMFGENANAYFKLDMFKKNRNIKKAFYPIRREDYSNKKNSNDIKKVDGEIRLVCADIATRKGKANDNTIMSCIRLLPTAQGYNREIVYMESHNGENTILQALRIKQIYHDFHADYIVLDLQQAGISIYQQLGIITKDEERGEEYEPFTVMMHESIEKSTHEELLGHTLAINAKPVIYPISASAKLNNDVAVEFRDKLQKNMISFLIDENEAEDYLMNKIKDFSIVDYSLKAWYLHPYRQITEMINEIVNLEYTIANGGNIKLQEPKSGRKDRYTSVSYGNYFASLLDKNLLRESKTEDFSALFNGNTRQSSNNKSSPFGTTFNNPFANRYLGNLNKRR